MRRNIRRFALTVWALLAIVSSSSAQNAITPSGQFTPGHALAALNTTGTVYGDAGGAAGSQNLGSNYLTEIGITNTGLPFCINDALTNSPSGYHSFCFGADYNGSGVISFNPNGGAASLPLKLILNGVTYTFPFTSSAGGAPNSIQYNNAGMLGGLGIVNNAVVITNGSGGPSESQTLPAAVQGNITVLGTIGSGTWNGAAITVPYGGTGLTALTANSLLAGNGTGAVNLIAPVNGDCLVGSGGAWVAGSCASAGVSSIAGTAGQITASASTGAVTLSLPSTITPNETFSGTVNMTGTFEIGGTGVSLPISVANGGTGRSTLTANAVLIGNTTSAVALVSEVDGACLLGAAGAWTAGSCTGSGAVGVGVSGGESIAHVGDSNSAIATGHFIVTTNASLSAARIWTLPVCATFGAHILHFYDDAGGIGATDTGSLLPNTSNTDTLNGSTSAYVLNSAYASVDLFCDGANPGNWTVLGGSTTLTAIPNKTILGNISGGAALPVALSSAATMATTTASTNVVFTLDDSGVSGGFRAALQLKNSERNWFLTAAGAADSLSSSGVLAFLDQTANSGSGYFRAAFGPTGGFSLAGSTGTIASDLGAGNLNAPLAGGYYLGVSKAQGVGTFTPVATIGLPYNTAVGTSIYQEGFNAAPEACVQPVLDLNGGNPATYLSGYQYPPAFPRACMDWWLGNNQIIQNSTNDQLQPAAIGVGGTWLTGDTFKMTIVYGPGGSSSVILQCSLSGSGTSWACGTASGTSALIAIAQYIDNYFSTTTFTQPLYMHPNAVTTVSISSVNYTGILYLTYWRTACCSFVLNQSTTAGGTVAASPPVQLLDGPVGHFIQRSVEPVATFTASAPGDGTLHVTAVASGTLLPSYADSMIYAPNLASGILLTGQSSGTIGGVGVYTLSTPITTGSQTIYNIREPQPGDNIGVVQFLMPTLNAPFGQIPGVEMVASIVNATSANANANLVIFTQNNGSGNNGVPRLQIQTGVSVCDLNGTCTDNGQGSLTVPDTIYANYPSPATNTHGILAAAGSSGYFGVYGKATAPGANSGGFYDSTGAGCALPYGATTWVCASDASLKTDVRNLRDDGTLLERMSKIDAARYVLVGAPETGDHIGVPSAQQMQKVFPELVHSNKPVGGEVKLGVEYEPTGMIAWSGVNALNAEIIALTKRVTALEGARR